MKTSKRFLPVPISMALALSLLTGPANLRAMGPGASGFVAGANNGASTGNTNVGAQGVSGARMGNGAVPGNGGRSFTAPAVAGGRAGVSFSDNSVRSFTSTYPRGAAGRAAVPSATYRGSPFAPSAASPAASYQPTGRVPGAPRTGNAWSGAANLPARANGRSTNPAIGYSSRSFDSANDDTDNRFTGQRLYRGAYGSGLANANRFMHGSRDGSDRDRNHAHRRHGYYPYYASYGNSYPYFPGYLPYLGSYYGSYGSPYFDAGSYYGLNSNSIATYDDNPNFAAPVAPGDTADAGQSPQQFRTEARPAGVPNNGPDSLVEAVQQELAKRGYFGGKIDAMYGADTKEALRLFQTDRHLAATGLINEATLHALQLD